VDDPTTLRDENACTVGIIVCVETRIATATMMSTKTDLEDDMSDLRRIIMALEEVMFKKILLQLPALSRSSPIPT
jgi:hypothetical protein